ncbi:exo-alpha-sialidase [Massilia endophytica]|uniref:exo-alpha-sialidase n=1 Tax=Massilia endophytica TaxID=2899220 RepID=UPI001E3A9C21|nr:exo-alpha-sialidase [Massilia endophytica]UGQ44778.1 exo-alpha-sialidase [Massilia endophytica]
MNDCITRRAALAACLLALCGAALSAPALEAAPQALAPGVISTAFHDFAASLTPDGNAVFFTRTDAGFNRMVLLQSVKRGGQWQAPTVLPFSGIWNDGDGVLSPDGRRYVFISNRPASGTDAKADLDLWQVLRDAGGNWGEPHRLPDHINSGVNEIYPSLAADGTLYFGRAGNGNPVFRSRLVDGAYQPPEQLPFNAFSFAVAPDQSFGIAGVLDAARNSDLFLVERNGEGWAAPQRIEGPLNSPQQEFASSISADGKTLLFASTRREGAAAWPRAKPVRSAADVAGELASFPFNGLRNIYSVDISALRK